MHAADGFDIRGRQLIQKRYQSFFLSLFSIISLFCMCVGNLNSSNRIADSCIQRSIFDRPFIVMTFCFYQSFPLVVDVCRFDLCSSVSSTSHFSSENMVRYSQRYHAIRHLEGLVSTRILCARLRALSHLSGAGGDRGEDDIDLWLFAC